jgi:hypothetical protein
MTPNKKTREYETLEAVIEYQDLLERSNEHSVLKRRRGRPPRHLEMAIVLVIEGEEYWPDDLITQATEVDGEQENEFSTGNDETTGNNGEASTDSKKEPEEPAGNDGTTGTSDLKEKDTTTSADGKMDSGHEESKTAEDGPTSGEVASQAPTSPVKDNTPEASDPIIPDDTKAASEPNTEKASQVESNEKPKQALESTDDEPRRPTRKRTSAVVDARQGEERKRRAVLHVHVPGNTGSALDDSESDNNEEEEEDHDDDDDDDDDEPEYKAKGTRTRALRKRKRGSKSDPIVDVPEVPADGMRRSSRHSSAREISLKEPDDTFTDSDGEVKTKKEKKRISRGWV